MTKRIEPALRIAAALIVIALFMTAGLRAQSQTVPARLSIRSGLVEVQRGNVWLPLAGGDPVNAGERVRTASGSAAALELGDRKVVTLNELSVVRVGQTASGPAVQLEEGSMKVFSASDIEIGVKDTVLDSAEVPLDMELGFHADRMNMTVFGGAVQNGRMVIRGGNVDPNSRTYTADSANVRNGTNGMQVPNPTFYVYPYFMYGNGMYGNGNWNGNGNGQRSGNRGRGNSGAIVPPQVNNPTNPGYQPTQIVPPMSDPIRVPVTKP